MPQHNPHTADRLPPRIILGSTSVYRKELLGRLRLPFEVAAPHVDERALPGELPAKTAARLASDKATAVAHMFDDDVVIIGSDQVAELHGRILYKPGTHANAVAQLQAMRGQTVHFHTAVCVKRPHTQFERTLISPVTVQVRAISDAEIETYLRLEQPYDCAGSAKCEGLGIVLLEHIASDDPTSLVGLPMIATTTLLQEAGVNVLTQLSACTTP